MEPTPEAHRDGLKRFAGYFKGYMGVMPVILAALAPLITATKVIDTYDIQREPLAAMTGIFAFLLLGWIFYLRRTIALGSLKKGFRWIMNLTPFLLIAASIFCFLAYCHFLDVSLSEARKLSPATTTRQQLLKTTGDSGSIPYADLLIGLYLTMFLCAVGAFVMMSLREYVIDVLQLSEHDWIFADQDGSKSPVELSNRIASGAVQRNQPPTA